MPKQNKRIERITRQLVIQVGSRKVAETAMEAILSFYAKWKLSAEPSGSAWSLYLHDATATQCKTATHIADGVWFVMEGGK